MLLDLPYFDPIECTAIDSMHNLFLRSGKHTFSVWIETDTLTKQNLKELEKRIKMFLFQVILGDFHHVRISSCYNSFTANQWKNWITLYSCVTLKDILPVEHYRCWQLFVRSCVITCSYCTRGHDFVSADLLLKEFCCLFERLYGPDKCTFNMHLHLHLKKLFGLWSSSHILVLCF